MITDYNEYHYTKEEWFKYFLIGVLIGGFIGYLFYSNLVGSLIFSLYGFYYVRNKKKDLISNRKWQLNLEFRDSLLSISSALNAGYSIENAFEQTLADLKLMYSKDSLIIGEYESIVNQIKMNITIESILEDFGDRTEIDDILNFSTVFSTAKRTGGDLIKIIRSTANTIGDKIEVKREIKTMITAKKFESKIMSAIPFGIIIYMRLFSPGFLDPLYNNIMGIFIMSALLIVYLFAHKLIDNIIEIEV